jgi:hypothetical protein
VRLDRSIAAPRGDVVDGHVWGEVSKFDDLLEFGLASDAVVAHGLVIPLASMIKDVSIGINHCYALL